MDRAQEAASTGMVVETIRERCQPQITEYRKGGLKKRMNQDCGAKTAQETIVSELMSLARSVQDRAGTVRERTEKRLEQITLSAIISPEGKSPIVDRQYPPLFDELRAIFRGIQVSLNAIDDNISRTAL